MTEFDFPERPEPVADVLIERTLRKIADRRLIDPNLMAKLIQGHTHVIRPKRRYRLRRAIYLFIRGHHPKTIESGSWCPNGTGGLTYTTKPDWSTR